MKSPDRSKIPSLNEEEFLEAQGYQLIAGTDEAGRGSLAGPVVAAAVILPRHTTAQWLKQVKDSKLLSLQMREFLFPHIHKAAISTGVGVVSHEMIDSQGIVKATKLAMKQAIEQLSPSPECLLIDYLSLSDVSLPQKSITGGDRISLSIACASIIAKVSRDRLMVEMDKTYPGYGLAQHKGYGTEAHFSCLRRMGPSPIHRKSFQPVRGIMQRDL